MSIYSEYNPRTEGKPAHGQVVMVDSIQDYNDVQLKQQAYTNSKLAQAYKSNVEPMPSPDLSPLESLKTDHDRGINYLLNTVLSLRSKMENVGLLRPEQEDGLVKGGAGDTPSLVRTPLEYWIEDKTDQLRSIERVVEELIRRSIV